MKILGIIFMALGVVGVIYSIPALFVYMTAPTNIPGSIIATSIILTSIVMFFSAMFVLLGYSLYKKSKMVDEISSKIQNLKARQKNNSEKFSLKIINEKQGFSLTELSVGVRINDEDKGRTAKEEENTYDLPDGSHKLQFYTTKSKNSVTNYSPVVVDFTKDTTLTVSFKFNKTMGGWEITN